MSNLITADGRGLGADSVQRLKAVFQRAKSGDKKAQRALEVANQRFLEGMRQRDVNGPLYSEGTLAQVSVQYKNNALIGGQLMPTIVVGKRSGKFFKYSKRDRLAAPETSVSKRSTPNEITESRTQDNYSTEGHALKGFVDAGDLLNQDAPLDEMLDVIAAVNDHLALAQEIRHADILTTASNYGSNTTTLAGASQWSDNSSNPFAAIALARRTIWSGASGNTRLIGFCSSEVLDVLRMHTQTTTAFKHMGGLIAPDRTQLARFYGLDDILVGDAWKDSANEGQAYSQARVWGKDFGIVRVSASPSIRTAAFGYTFQFGQVETNEWYDPSIGVRGGYYARVGHEVDEKVVAADTGYLFKAAVA
jgi:hypothetical protein